MSYIRRFSNTTSKGVGVGVGKEVCGGWGKKEDNGGVGLRG